MRNAKTMRKNGASHVEFMLSFAIFIIFLAFMFSFFNPLKKTSVDSSILTVLEKAVRDKTDIKITTTSLVLGKNLIGGISNCFGIESITGENIIAKVDGLRINSEDKSGRDYIEYKGDKVYELFISNNFIENGVSQSCTEINSGSGSNYTLGVTKEKKFIFMKNLEKFKEDYDKDYDKLKKDMVFPQQNDFGIVLMENNGKEVFRALNKEPTGTGVQAQNLNVEVVDENATIKSMILNIRAW